MQRYLDAATGLTNLTVAKAERVAKALVRSGEVASDQVGEFVEELLERQRRNRDAVTSLVKKETARAVEAAGLATSDEVERLKKQVADLKREVGRLEQAVSGTSSGPRKAAKKGTKKTTKKQAKKTTKRAAKKGTKKSAGGATKRTESGS